MGRRWSSSRRFVVVCCGFDYFFSHRLMKNVKKKVFDLVSGDFVDQAEFCVVAALAERMTLLE